MGALKWVMVSLVALQAHVGATALLDRQNEQAHKLIQSLVELQKSHHLDGTVLLADGQNEVVLLDNSQDGLDPMQGLSGQYFLGSSGKQMTAVALVKALSEHTKDAEHALQEPLSHFLPPDNPTWKNVGFPEWANQVTLHELLCHRSGIPDFTRFDAFLQKNSAGKSFEEEPHEAWEFLQLIKGAPLDFEPGRSELYSNTNYTLAKEVIRTLTKMAPEEYMNKFLFQPLGMHDTKAIPSGTWPELRKKEATKSLLKPLAYDPRGSFQNISLVSYLPDCGGSGPVTIVSTALDLLRWNTGLHMTHAVLPKKLYELVVTPYSKGPSGNGYGYGIAMDKTRFGIDYNHASASTQIVYVPSLALSIIVLTHVNYDWNLVEPEIQARKHELEKPGVASVEAEQQAVQEILKKYPIRNRGFEAIMQNVNAFLGIK